MSAENGNNVRRMERMRSDSNSFHPEANQGAAWPVFNLLEWRHNSSSVTIKFGWEPSSSSYSRMGEEKRDEVSRGGERSAT